MDAFNLIKEKVSYNQWANLKIVDWLRQQPVGLYDKNVISSFSSIRKLMQHIMEAEKYYFAVLQAKSENYKDDLSSEQIFEELLRIDRALLEWLLSLPETDMGKTYSLKRSPFVETYSTATLITHLINHTTYHRGQLVSLRHQLGMSVPPKTDYYRYFIAQTMKP